MSAPLIMLIAVIVIAASLAAWAVVGNQSRAAVIGRATEQRGRPARLPPVLTRETPAMARHVEHAMTSLLPDGMLDLSSTRRLVRAGFDHPSAPALYVFLRVLSAAAFPALALIALRYAAPIILFTAIGAGALLGLLLPPVILRRLERMRQRRVVHAIPDCLDLLLVCVEAGVSLDAALLRVGREMQLVHPDLAEELLVINRKSNAGMRREDALHGLYDRTGVTELRTLASAMVQSEKWGSSIGRVLRVHAEGLRRKRRQVAEKAAALAATKMVFPMVLFILPALFIVIGGPMLIGLDSIWTALGLQ